MSNFFDTKIEFLKGVGPQKADLLKKELAVFTYGDLLQHYPFRHEDRTKYFSIGEIKGNISHIQIKGKVIGIDTVGSGRKQRLSVTVKDDTGTAELIWFKGISWVKKLIHPGQEYIIFGKPTIFNSRINFAHPEIEIVAPSEEKAGYLQAIYNTTELLRKRYLDSKGLSKLIKILLEISLPYVQETLPNSLIEYYGLISKKEALYWIHVPPNFQCLEKAKARLKFEELFYVQLKLLSQKSQRQEAFKGQIFSDIPSVATFYNSHLPFDLTDAQKRVIKEIRKDLNSGKQMNRLLQGDVGSGKTIVAFIVMLMAIDNNSQSCIMAPTEILAEQHYQGLKEYADLMDIKIGLLTGSTKKSERNILFEGLESGEISLIVGTHALLEDTVQFKNLGLCVIDEQHRFGVAQRARLWKKNKTVPPHILVMTATPIPRTLAMTLYGDLDVSVIDELPKGRKPIQTLHKYDSSRLQVFGLIKKEIEKGRQIYIVYPLIEESEKLDLKDLQDGVESISRAFPKPQYQLSVLHGKMKSQDKDYEIQRFIKGETQIMIATTVIEVGVNVPNASVMIIENAERFGLAQLHQLRGRVGRGAEQSYCILMSDYKLSKEARIRLDTMVRTNNGFEIADVDLKLRGPGDMAGTQQSGVMDLIIADIAKDVKILQEARHAAQKIVDEDPRFENPANINIKRQVESMKKSTINWSRIS